MKSIFILEDEDEVETSDLCRPLNPSGMLGLSKYGNYIKNNAKWIPITEVLGPIWIGMTLGEIKNELAKRSSNTYVFEYEIIRGEVPIEHLLDVDTYKQNVR
jgi:hypothetical protein